MKETLSWARLAEIAEHQWNGTMIMMARKLARIVMIRHHLVTLARDPFVIVDQLQTTIKGEKMSEKNEFSIEEKEKMIVLVGNFMEQHSIFVTEWSKKNLSVVEKNSNIAVLVSGLGYSIGIFCQTIEETLGVDSKFLSNAIKLAIDKELEPSSNSGNIGKTDK